MCSKRSPKPVGVITINANELGMQKEKKIYIWMTNLPFEENFPRESRRRFVSRSREARPRLLWAVPDAPGYHWVGVLEMWDMNHWDPGIAPSDLDRVNSVAIRGVASGPCRRRVGFVQLWMKCWGPHSLSAGSVANDLLCAPCKKKKILHFDTLTLWAGSGNCNM